MLARSRVDLAALRLAIGTRAGPRYGVGRAIIFSMYGR